MTERAVTFTIPGKPFAKQRPYFSRKQGRAFTPAKTVRFESIVRTMAAELFPQPFEGAVGVYVWATFEPAQSWSKRKRTEHLGQYHLQKPDSDNIQKAILDGLNRIAYADDSQVADMHCRKVWGQTSNTVVTITQLYEIEEGGPHESGF